MSQTLPIACLFLFASLSSLVEGRRHLDTNLAKTLAPNTQRQVGWYVNAGNSVANLAFTKLNRASLTSLYLCCNRFSINNTGALLAPAAAKVKAETQDLKAEGIEVLYVMGLGAKTLESKAWVQGVQEAAAAASSLGFEGFIVDYEPDFNYTRAHALAYSELLSALGDALHSKGLVLGFNVASWGILNRWDVYNASRVDLYVSMSPTYFGTNIAANKAFVQSMTKAGIPPSKISVGLGTMLAPGGIPKWDYNWTEPDMRSFVGWLSSSSMTNRLAFWRADINNYQTTSPFILDVARAFLEGR